MAGKLARKFTATTLDQVRRPWGGKMPLPCSVAECGRVTTDLYWRDAKGKPLAEPICSQCFEQQLRRLTRESE